MDLGRIAVGETGTEGRTVGRCEIFEGMNEMVGRCEARMDKSGTEVNFSHIIRPSMDLSLVCRFMRRVVDSGKGLHGVFGCHFSNSAFSTDGVYSATYFVQSVLELRVVATFQTTHRRLLFP